MSQAQHKPEGDTGTAPRAFEVRVDGGAHGAFRDLRDAIDAARIVKLERPQAMVRVLDKSTGQIVVEP
ncbi:MAG: hypothetical protein KGM42_01615 [Hyphomicrobiales bacterium]|nr:hypothetical protein [Hyphomicrobiales bacterium]